MGEITNTQKILFSEFTREQLGQMIVNIFTNDVPVENIINNSDEEYMVTAISGNQQIRYFEEKRMFLLLMFGPDLSSVYKVANSPRDYMIGLLLYISSTPNFSYSFGLFKDRMNSFENLISKWNRFLDNVVKDISSIQKISMDNILILEVEDMLRFYISENSIVDFKFNMDNFDRIFKSIGEKYQFRIYLSQGEKEQLFTTGCSNGDGIKSGLCLEICQINNLINSIKGKPAKEVLTINE